MIHTSRTVTVGKMESVINEPIMLYRGDREVEIEFNIVGSKFMFSNGGNVIKSTNATNGQLVINTPTGENMFSEVTECNDGKVICVITKEMIDELAEVGFYSFQIRLFDESQVSRVTIPPVYQGIEIRNPIAAEDETDLVDIGLVDFSVVRKDNYENVVTFLPNGDYNKTLWEEHDVISKDRLNKVEDALYEINKGTEGLYPTFQNQYDEFSAKVDKDVKAYKEEMEDEVEQFERDMTQAFGEFSAKVNKDVKAHKEEIEDEVEQFERDMTQAFGEFKVDATEEAIQDILNVTNYVYPLEYFKGNTHQEQIENAINYLSGKNATIQLRGITYRFQNIILPSNISLVGEGNTIIKPIGNSSNPLIRFHSNSSLKNLTIDDDGIVMKGVFFGYNGSNVTEKHNNIVIENVSFKINNEGNYAIVIGYCENVKINNCDFENNQQTKSAILIHCDSPNTISNVTVSGCSVRGFDKGIHSYGTGIRQYINCAHNLIINCASGGIDMYHACKSTVINNTIDNCGIGIWGDTIGLDTNAGQGTVISNNQIFDCDTYGIYCEELCGTSLNNNSVFRCGIGIYGGAGLKYASFVNNNISFCGKGMLISNEYVPTPMISFFNQDCNIKGNTICYNEGEGIILKGVKGVWVIENNDIFDNNTSNIENIWGLTVIDDPAANQNSQMIILNSNRIHNSGRGVAGTEGYQQGAYIKCGNCLMQNNYFNNTNKDLHSYYCNPVFITNIFNSETTTQGVCKATFGNIGLFEGYVVTDPNKGIAINQALTELPTPVAGDEGRIVKIGRTSSSDELYYICKRKANGTWAWVEIFK